MTLYMAIDNHHQPIMINQRISIYICSIEPSSQGLCVTFLKTAEGGEDRARDKNRRAEERKTEELKGFWVAHICK